MPARKNNPAVGDIYYADLPWREHVQSGKRPVIIAQNNIGNMNSPIIHVIPLTRQLKRAGSLPTHVTIRRTPQNGLKDDSVALIEDLNPIPAECLMGRIGRVGDFDTQRIKNAFKIQFPFAG